MFDTLKNQKQKSVKLTQEQIKSLEERVEKAQKEIDGICKKYNVVFQIMPSYQVQIAPTEVIK